MILCANSALKRTKPQYDTARSFKEHVKARWKLAKDIQESCIGYTGRLRKALERNKITKEDLNQWVHNQSVTLTAIINK